MYGSEAEIEEYLGTTRYLVLADRDNDGVAESPLVLGALTRATSFVNGFLTRYLPFAVVPSDVVQATLDVATFYLAGNKKSEQERERYEDAVKWLILVSKGTVNLPLPPEEPVAGGTLEVVSEERRFTRASLAGVL